MSFKCFYIAITFCTFFFNATIDSYAQTPIKNESANIDIVLTYHKLIGETPKFEYIFTKTTRYKNTPEFAKKQILYQGNKNLKTYFTNIDEKTTFVKKDKAQIDTVNLSSKTFSLDGFNEDTHYLFDHDKKNYALFIRNINILKKLPIIGPIRNYIIKQQKNSKPIELTFLLSPLAADKKPIFIEEDKPLNMILTDIVGVTVKSYKGKNVEYYPLISPKKDQNYLDKVISKLKVINN